MSNYAAILIDHVVGLVVTHPPWEWQITTKTECGYLYGWIEKSGHMRKNLTQNGGPERYSWEHRRRRESGRLGTAPGFPQSNNNNNRIQRCNSRFFTISSLRCEPSQTHMLKWPGRIRMQITCNKSSTYYMQHVVLHGTWYNGTAQLWNSTESKLHLFELYFIGWTINRWRRGGNQSTRSKPLAASSRKCHILKPDDSSPKRDSNPHNSIGGRLGKRMC